jgi:hypothetical protein
VPVLWSLVRTEVEEAGKRGVEHRDGCIGWWSKGKTEAERNGVTAGEDLMKRE